MRRTLGTLAAATVAVSTLGTGPAPARHRGAGTFLHVNGRGATAGCVSVPRWFMVHLMRDLAPSARPVMAVGR
jgi:L,D-peptidoglycan transpeptidase YkuD (ErfK/YbiS/YcfS/YnhG family)